MDITRIVYGRSTMAESWIFPGGEETRRYPIDFAFFLLRGHGRCILVDAGCDTMSGFIMEDFIGPVAALARHGVTPEDITDILITHAHHDHMAGVCHFPKAHVYVQEKEFERGRKYLTDGQQVTLFEQELLPFPGIRMVTVAGHSIGSSVVEVDGHTVLCGDECYNRYNLEHMVPTAKSRDEQRSRAFLDRYHSWNCLLCHDP